MNMIRQRLDDYLDGTLDSGQRSEVERQLAGDPAVASLFAQMKGERALRAAVFSGYEPSERESRELAGSILAACRDQAHAPVGRIGYWVKRSLGVAAAVGILAGTFAMGRMSAPVLTAPSMVTQVPEAPSPIIRVLYNDEAGEPQMKEFVSMDDATTFEKEMMERHAEPVAVASTLDAEHPGSF
jgi:anti-sigma factor RsiW